MTKLSLRDLFAVVTIVALALGWWLDTHRTGAINRELTAVNRELKASLDDVAHAMKKHGFVFSIDYTTGKAAWAFRPGWEPLPDEF